MTCLIQESTESECGAFSVSAIFAEFQTPPFISCRACSEMCTASLKFLFCSTTSMKILPRSRIFSSLFSFCCDDMEEKWICIFSILWNIRVNEFLIARFSSASLWFFFTSLRFSSAKRQEFFSSSVPSIKRGYIFLRRHCYLLTFRKYCY